MHLIQYTFPIQLKSYQCTFNLEFQIKYNPMMAIIKILNIIQTKIMDTELKNSFYLHTIEHQHSQRSIIKSYHSFINNTHVQQIAIANHNTIEIYRNVGTSIVYERTANFMCDISFLEVIPVKGQSTDLLFMGDQLGRFMFWSPAIGVISANNHIRAPEYLTPFYQKAPIQDKPPQFSGVAYHFNTLDTEGTLFFTVSTKIIVLKIRWSKGKIYFLHAPSQITCPYLDTNFIGLINTKQPLIGIVEQREQKSFLRFHKANSQHFECTMTLQKPNLSSFYSSPQGQQIITVTNSQLSIYNTKSQQIICTFQISQSGSVCNIANDLYVYIGELGSQMIVFSKKHYKNYGSFMLQNQVCMKLAAHGILADGGYLISVIDQGHTVQFIAIYEQVWKSIRSIFGTSSIFSVEDLQKNNQCLAVLRVSDNIHQIGILSKNVTSKLEKQTVLKTPILNMFSANKGKAIIISTYDTNSVLIYDSSAQCYQLSFQFDSGIIVQVLDKYVVMEHKIYIMDLTKNTIKQVLQQKKQKIISANFDNKFISYMCQDNSYKFYNTQTNQIDRIRKNCQQQYIWHYHKNQILVVAFHDLIGKVKIMPIFKQATVVSTGHNELICSMCSYAQYLIISYMDCHVFIYQYATMNVVKIIQQSSQPLKLLQCPQQNYILAYGNNQSYLISFSSSKISYEQVQFDPAKQNHQILYVGHTHKFLIAHQHTMSQYSIQTNKPQYTSNFRVVSMTVAANNQDALPPFATVRNNIVYVISTYQIIMRNMYTAQLLKKQSHGMKEISCVEKLDIGLLVCGIDDMDCGQIFVFSYHDIQILWNQSLGKRIAYAVKKKQNNSFFIREESSITLYEIKQSIGLKQIFTSKIGLNGYTLGLQTQLSMLIASDPLRYLVAYDYRLNKLVSLCRFQNTNTINDIQFIQCAVALGDSVGNLSIAQFNFDKGQVLRTTMTQVANIKVGSEILRICKGKEGVMYSTISGSVGRIRALSPQQFSILKQAQKQILNELQSNKNQLRYQQWTNRFTTNDKIADKLVDGFLIEVYLDTKKSKNSKFQEVKQIWQSLGIKKN